MATPVFQSGSPVSFTVAVPDGVASAVAVVVKDQLGATVGTISPTLPVGTTPIEFTVPFGMNTLASGVSRSARTVVTTITTDSGVYIQKDYYLVEADTQLVMLGNSFQTYEEALMTRADLAALNGWEAADERNRVAALKIAHNAMCSMVFQYRVGVDGQSRIAGYGGTNMDGYGRVWVIVPQMDEVLQPEWDVWPDNFKLALKRAQVTEADNLLRGDPIGEKRRAGIISETIGQTSMFLRQTPEVRVAICRDAMDHLRGYTITGTRIARGS